MSEIKYLTHREAAQARLNGENLLWKGRAADYAGGGMNPTAIALILAATARKARLDGDA